MKKITIFIAYFIIIISVTSCSSIEGVDSVNDVLQSEIVREPNEVTMFLPSASGSSVFQTSRTLIDYSNSSKGYVMVQYLGSNTGKIKFRVETPIGETYTYDLHGKSGYQTIPLSEGDGYYTFTMYEQASGDQYYVADSYGLSIYLESEFSPFLHSNQYVDFTSENKAIIEAADYYQHTVTDIDFIKAVYSYTMNTIAYDDEMAAAANSGNLSGYLPALDTIVDSGKGICFDYAALMTAMLRSQGVPTKMTFGYAGDVYHAWISVYTEEAGWLDDVIQFDGVSWALVDPTFKDNQGGSSAVSEFIGDGDNYVKKYVY